MHFTDVSTGPQLVFLINLGISFVLIMIFSANRLNQGQYDRSYTTLDRYALGFALCYMLYLFSYGLALVLLFFPVLIWSDLLRPFTTSVPVFAALVSVYVFRFDTAWCMEQFGKITRIPDQALAMCGALLETPFNVPKELEVDIAEQLRQQGLGLYLFAAGPPRTIYARWVQASVLLHWFEVLVKRDSGYAEFFLTTRNNLIDLKHRYGELFLKSARTFRLLANNSNLPRGNQTERRSFEQANEVLENEIYSGYSEVQSKMDVSQFLLSQLRADVNRFLEEIVFLLCRSVLYNEPTFKRRRTLLREIGFEVEERPQTLGLAILPLGLVFAGMLISLSVIGTSSNRTNGLPRLTYISSLILLWQTITVWSVFQIKERFPGANISITNRGPMVVMYIGLALFVCVVCFVLTIILHSLWALWGISTFTMKWLPWLMIPAVTSSALLFILQSRRWESQKTRLRIVLDGLCVGLCGAVAVWLAVMFRSYLQTHTAFYGGKLETTRAGYMIRGICVGFVVFSGLGASLGRAYRRQVNRMEVTKEEDIATIP